MESVCLGPREPVHERPIDAVTCAPAAAAGNKLTPPSPTCEPLGGKGCFVYCDPHTCVKMCSPEKLAIRAGYSLGHAFHPIFACIMDRTHTSFLTWCVAALQAPLCLFFFAESTTTVRWQVSGWCWHGMPIWCHTQIEQALGLV